MSIQTYKNGSWEETIPFVYKNGVWEQASSVKVYENGEWVEKIASYDNMTIEVTKATGYGLFAANKANYIKCSANNIKCLCYVHPEQMFSGIFRLVPPGSNFGYSPTLTFDYYMKSNGMVKEGTYPMYFTSLSYNIQEYGRGVGSIIASFKNEQEISGTRSIVLDVSESSQPITDIYFNINISDTEYYSYNSSIYVEINNIKLNGVPYGINQTITP